MNGEKHPRTAAILYGTETGNAQDIAEELGAMAERLHFTTVMSEMDNFQPVGRCAKRRRNPCRVELVMCVG